MPKQKRQRTAPMTRTPPCTHTVTEEIAYDEPGRGRDVAADRCWQCGAVKMRGGGKKWVPPGEKMKP